MKNKGLYALASLLGVTLLLILIPGGLTEANVSQAAQLPQIIHNAPYTRGLNAASVLCSVEITTTDSAPFNNDSFDTATNIAPYTGQSLLDISGTAGQTTTVSIPTRSDFFRLDNALTNYKYTIQAQPDRTTNYNLGIIVYDKNRTPIYTDTNTSSYSANIIFEATEAGPYFIEIFQISAQCKGGTYQLLFSEPLAPTATSAPPTPTRTPTPRPAVPQPTSRPPTGFDQYEPNFDFERASLIAPGITYNMNFVPWSQWANDNDFLRLWVKPGLRYTCETSNLDPAVDPNMIFYTAPDFNAAIVSNDDIALGNFNSRISYYSAFEGYLYILVGQGERMKPQDTSNSAYSFRCEMTVPGATAPGTPGYTPAPAKDPYPTAIPTRPPTVTPRPAESPIATPESPTPTPTPEPVSGELGFILITTPEPVAPTPTPGGFRTFQVRVYFDANQDEQLGAGEGIAGFFIRALAPEDNAELARGYTDEQGQVSFTVSTVGTVRVLVPLLGFDRMIEADKPEIVIRIAPPPLPDTIP